MTTTCAVRTASRERQVPQRVATARRGPALTVALVVGYATLWLLGALTAGASRTYWGQAVGATAVLLMSIGLFLASGVALH